MTDHGDLTAVRHADGDVQVVRADARIGIHPEFLESADPRFVQHGDGPVRICGLLYRFTSETGYGGCLIAEFIRAVPLTGLRRQVVGNQPPDGGSPEPVAGIRLPAGTPAAHATWRRA